MGNGGKLFVTPGAALYEGMIIGESAKDQDIGVNVTKGKKLTNTRASGSDPAIRDELGSRSGWRNSQKWHAPPRGPYPIGLPRR